MKLNDEQLGLAKKHAAEFGSLIHQTELEGDAELRKQAREEWVNFRNGFLENGIDEDQYQEIINAHWTAFDTNGCEKESTPLEV